MSWFTAPTAGAYAASKAAAWSLTDSTRLELTAQGTHVVAVHMGLVDTDMADIAGGAATARQALVAGVVDELTLDVRRSCSARASGSSTASRRSARSVEVLHPPLATHIRFRRSR